MLGIKFLIIKKKVMKFIKKTVSNYFKWSFAKYFIVCLLKGIFPKSTSTIRTLLQGILNLIMCRRDYILYTDFLPNRMSVLRYNTNIKLTHNFIFNIYIYDNIKLYKARGSFIDEGKNKDDLWDSDLSNIL